MKTTAATTTTTSIDSYLAALDDPLREVGEAARAIIDTALPDAHAAIWHGHPVWSLGAAPGQQPVCLLKAYRSYVTFGLWRGRAIVDPSGRLEPGARDMARIRMRSIADVDPELFTSWLHQAGELEQAARFERTTS